VLDVSGGLAAGRDDQPDSHRSVSGVGVAIGIGMVKDFQKFPSLDPIVCVWLASTATCDVCITASLSLYLVSISAQGDVIRVF
jgi:hypothetical protein